jgi:hypothetical protein
MATMMRSSAMTSQKRTSRRLIDAVGDVRGLRQGAEVVPGADFTACGEVVQPEHEDELVGAVKELWFEHEAELQAP